MGHSGAPACKLMEEEGRDVVLAEAVVAPVALLVADPVTKVALVLYPGVSPVPPKCHFCHQCHPWGLSSGDSHLVGEQRVTPVLPRAPRWEQEELFESETPCLMDFGRAALPREGVFDAAVPTCPWGSNCPHLLTQHGDSGPAGTVDGL